MDAPAAAAVVRIDAVDYAVVVDYDNGWPTVDWHATDPDVDAAISPLSYEIDSALCEELRLRREAERAEELLQRLGAA